MVGGGSEATELSGAVEGNFPSLSRPEPMFDLAVLDGPISQSERNRARYEDERRLFRMVLGRARRRVILTASDRHPDELSARSRFAAEVGVEWRPAPDGPFEDPVSVREAAAVWRRTLANLDAPSAQRLAALEGLVVLGVDPTRWWFQREWTDTGRPLHETIRVSFSRLDKLVNCALQYVLSEELGLEGQAGYYAWVGHTVHAAQRGQRTAVRGDGRGHDPGTSRRRERPDEGPSSPPAAVCHRCPLSVLCRRGDVSSRSPAV